MTTAHRNTVPTPRAGTDALSPLRLGLTHRRLPIGPLTPITSRQQLPPHIADWLPAGAELVHTAALQNLLDGARAVLQSRKTILIGGKPGGGKSLAMATLQAALPVRCAEVLIEADTNGKDAVAALYEAVIGQRPGDQIRRELTYELRDALSEEPLVLFIDEAQNIELSVLRNLRFLLQYPGTKFAMVLGGTGIVERVQSIGMLNSWVRKRVNFNPMTGTVLLDVLGRWHPMLSNAQDDLLLEIDRVYAHGNLRCWSDVLEWAIDFEGTDGTLDKGVALDVLEEILHRRVVLKVA